MSNAPIKCLHSEVWPIERFKPNPRNPNKHPEVQIHRLAKIIVETGWRSPIVVSDRSGLVTKGHGRLTAAAYAGLKECPVEIQHYESDEAEIADMIADNRIAELSEMDEFALHGVLSDLKGAEKLELSGFSDAEFQQIEEQVMAANELPPDKLAPVPRERTNEKSDTAFRYGTIKFQISREDFFRWQQSLRASIGFKKRTIIEEIKRRLEIV